MLAKVSRMSFVQYHKYLFKDDEESLNKQYHMLPKKLMDKDAEGDNETLVEGKQAIQSFKETLNLHLAQHIEK